MRLLMVLAIALGLAAPAQAADVVIRTLDEGDLVFLDAYRDRVVWVEDEAVWTYEAGKAMPLAVDPVVGMDVTAGPDGSPVAILERCPADRCRYWLYDFAARAERPIKGAPTGKIGNFAFWRDRFVFVQDARLYVKPLDGPARGIGRARLLGKAEIDFNGGAVAYVRELFFDNSDRIEFRLAYWPLAAPGRILMSMAHGASGELSLSSPRVTPTTAYVTQSAGEFGGPYRLWRLNLRSGERRDARLPYGTTDAVPLGASRALAHVCDPEEEGPINERSPCTLVLRPLTYRAP